MIPRTVYLGQEVTCTALFLTDNNTEIIPSNSSLYPVYKVLGPNNELITAGIGIKSESTGLYEAQFTVPSNATLSNDKNSYAIYWVMEDTYRVLHTVRESFDVAHPSFNITSTKEHQKVTLSFVSLDISMPIPNKPEEITFSIYDSSENVVFTCTPENTGLFSEYYIYSVTIPANTLTASTQYLSCWNFTLGGSNTAYTQPIYCATLDDLQSASNMRMYLDKVMKDSDLFQGYRESDLIFHYHQGVELINTLGRPTTWTINIWNTELKDYKWLMMEAAKYSCLRAQYLAEGDSAFDFSHQSCTLTVDRTQYIEAEIGRIWDYLQSVVPNFKKVLARLRCNVGHLGLAIPTVGQAWGRINRNFEGVPLPRPVVTMK